MKDLFIWIFLVILLLLLGLAGKSDYKHQLEIEQAKEELEIYLETQQK